jgi:hypothetical protein
MQNAKCKMQIEIVRERRRNQQVAAVIARGLHFEFCILHYL